MPKYYIDEAEYIFVGRVYMGGKYIIADSLEEARVKAREQAEITATYDMTLSASGVTEVFCSLVEVPEKIPTNKGFLFKGESDKE